MEFAFKKLKIWYLLFGLVKCTKFESRLLGTKLFENASPRNMKLIFWPFRKQHYFGLYSQNLYRLWFHSTRGHDDYNKTTGPSDSEVKQFEKWKVNKICFQFSPRSLEWKVLAFTLFRGVKIFCFSGSEKLMKLEMDRWHVPSPSLNLGS